MGLRGGGRPAALQTSSAENRAQSVVGWRRWDFAGPWVSGPAAQPGGRGYGVGSALAPVAVGGALRAEQVGGGLSGDYPAWGASTLRPSGVGEAGCRCAPFGKRTDEKFGRPGASRAFISKLFRRLLAEIHQVPFCSVIPLPAVVSISSWPQLICCDSCPQQFLCPPAPAPSRPVPQFSEPARREGAPGRLGARGAFHRGRSFLKVTLRGF